MMNIIEFIVKVLLFPIMAKLVVKLKKPPKLVEDNNYFYKESKTTEIFMKL